MIHRLASCLNVTRPRSNRMRYYGNFETVFAVILLLITLPSHLCAGSSQDLSLWTWLQAEKRLGHHRYAEVQCQLRFDHNVSEFNRANYYFIVGQEFGSHWQAEVLYQLNTNRHSDQHTFFGGVTYKQKLAKHFSLYYRCSVQTVRNYFTGDPVMDRPYTELRNRLRFSYKFNNRFSAAVSGEPYIKITQRLPAYLSRIRYVSALNYRLNKYQTWTVFYLVEPDVITYGRHNIDYVMGITGHFRLPDKWSGVKKMFHYKNHEKDDATEDKGRDTLN